MSIAVLQNLMKEFGESIGISGLQLDEDNRCNLMFDDIAVSFELSQDEESIYIYSYLGNAPVENRESFYARLLDANYIFRRTTGATLGMEEESRKVVLARQYELGIMRLENFESAVEQFVNLAEYWKQQIPTLAEARPDAGKPRHDDDANVEIHAMKV